MNISSLYGNILPVSGNFGDLSVFDFSGVYILYNENQEDEIVYIGSSYSRKIKKRLAQYTQPNDSGNSLLKRILKVDYNCDIKSASQTKINQAIEYIKSLRIIAIPHSDLETSLIQNCDPKYNDKSKLR
jgi:excinuclease UvrABC nuclease subunit